MKITIAMLHDDGLHGDGAAGDGVYGVDVTCDQMIGFHDWKIATSDWSLNYPLDPVNPTWNAKLWTTELFETIHFRLDTNTVGDGWQPAQNAVSCSHYAPPGSEYEVIGSAVEIGEWNWGVPAALDGDVWTVDVTIAAPGVHEFKFRVLDDWDLSTMGLYYNMQVPGGNFWCEQFTPDRTWRFQWNTVTGRGRAVDVTDVPNEAIAWGDLKSLFRD